MTQWEFMYVQGGSLQLTQITDQVNRLGALGWEPVGVTSSDKTLGLNAILVTLKRPITHPPEPPASRDEWQPDPTKRHERRRWTWRGWGAEVMTGKERTVDPPNMYPDPPVTGV